MDAQPPGGSTRRRSSRRSSRRSRPSRRRPSRRPTTTRSPARLARSRTRSRAWSAGQEGLRPGHRDRDRRAAGPVEGGAQAGRPDGSRATRAAGTIPAPAPYPRSAPPDQLNLEAGKHQVNQEMADADVTDSSSPHPTSPSSSGAWPPSRRPRQHADTAPGRVPRAGAGHPAEQGRRERAEHQGRAWPACTAPRWRRWPAGRRQGQGQDQGRGQARRGHDQGPGHLRRHRGRREADPRRHRPQGGRRTSSRGEGRAGDVRDATSPRRWPPTRRTATAAGSAACGGPRTSCSGCRTRSTSSTRPAASSTSRRWTGSSPGSPTSSPTT